jgi:hypothetical protein
MFAFMQDSSGVSATRVGGGSGSDNSGLVVKFYNLMARTTMATAMPQTTRIHNMIQHILERAARW